MLARRAPLTQELQDAKSVTAKQVGPAPGKSRTIVAFEAAVIDWLPCVRIASWPGGPGVANEEAGDTSVVHPFCNSQPIQCSAFEALTRES